MPANYHSVLREQSGIPFEKDEDTLKRDELKLHVAEISRTLKVNWLQEELTHEFFKSLSAQVTELETRARELACAYHINNNHQEIIYLLIRAEQLRNIIKSYGSVSTS
jgi:hypothetical protein